MNDITIPLSDIKWIVYIFRGKKVKLLLITNIICTNYCQDDFTPCEFFIPALACGLSLKSENQQESSSLQDSSQYSCQS